MINPKGGSSQRAGGREQDYHRASQARCTPSGKDPNARSLNPKSYILNFKP